MASHTVSTSCSLSRSFQYAESSCQGTRLPSPGGLLIKWLDHKTMSGPINASTKSSTSSASSHSKSSGWAKCGTSIASGRLPAGKSANKPAKKACKRWNFQRERADVDRRNNRDRGRTARPQQSRAGSENYSLANTFLVVVTSIYGNPLTRAVSDAPRP